jgi:ketosteroid isomerase-like protein
MRIEITDRIAIQELLARYCHAVDHDDGDGWADCFAPAGIFEIYGTARLEGREQLRGMPRAVAEQGGGKWRHQITSIVVDPGSAPDTAIVRAYGLVTDWREGGKFLTFTDYELNMRCEGGAWRIVHLLATACG